MTVQNPPYVAQGRTDHPAVLFRMALGAAESGPMAAGATSPVGGVNPSFGSALAVSGLASMNIQVGTGFCFMPSSTAWNGMYGGYNAATLNLAVAASSSTQWRTDRVDAVVVDPGDNTANWNCVVTTGSFSSSSPGSTPSAPANSTPLGLIRVVPNMTVTNGAGTVVDNRTYQPLNGPIVTTSSARPSLSSPNGTMWYETDTQLLGVIVGGAYNYISTSAQASTAWQTMNPLINSWSVGAGNYSKYRFSSDGRSVIISFSAVPGTITDGTAVNNAIAAAYRPISAHTFTVATQNTPSTDVPRMTLNTGGVLSCAGLQAGDTLVSFDVTIPLDV